MSITSLLRQYTTELTATGDNVQVGLIDQVHSQIAYLWAMANKARPMGGIVFESGGELLRFDIIHATNNNTKPIDGWDMVEPTPTDEATVAFEGWSTNATPVAIPLTDILKNAMPGSSYKLAPIKYQIATMAHQSELHRQLVAGKLGTTGVSPTLRFQRGGHSDPTLDDKCLLPLGYLLQKSGSMGPAGSPNVDSIHGKVQTIDTYFQNQEVVSAATTFAMFRREVRKAIRLGARGSTNDAPDLALAHGDYYDCLSAAMDAQKQYQDVKSVQGQFDSIQVGPCSFYVDDVLPGFGDTASDAVTLAQSGTQAAAVFLNTNWIQIVVHEDAYVQPLPWNVMANRLGVGSTIVTMASHRVTQRRKHVIHLGVAATTITG